VLDTRLKGMRTWELRKGWTGQDGGVAEGSVPPVISQGDRNDQI
jgi:hypothetical protein